MGLDAHVLCTCFREGKTKPHPFPELLVYDEVEGPVLDSDAEPTLEQWQDHDRWRANACPHKDGELISIRLGNISLIAQLRADIESIKQPSTEHFAVLLEKVLYSGTHSGDFVPANEVPELRHEVNLLCKHPLDEPLAEFVDSMTKLCEASLQSGNPIVF